MRRLILLSLLAAIACARYVDNAREKRDIEAHDWLTEAQKSELKALKESADAAALKKRTMELYELLPAAEKEKWNGKYKEMCVAWIKEVATAEENENYKKWKAEGKMEEITSQYKKLKERLSEHKRKDVELWENECWSLWKDEFPASRGRRSVMDLAEEKLAFLGAEKIAELKALKESGATDDVIRDKVVSWTLEHWKSSDSKVSTADFVKKCYGWIKDVTQAEEYAAFEKLHHTDHEACRVKVKEFLARLPADKQSQVEKSLPLCDAIWYKQHQEEHGAHGDHDHHAHKHHAKRHLNTMHIEKYMGWLSQEQKDEIKKMEAGGDSYETLIAKMKGWYDALEASKKAEVREDFKDKCSDWVFAKTTETEQYDLQEFIQMADKDGLVEYLKKVYNRLTEDEKHEVDHTKDMCLTVWTTAPERKRRDHHHHEEYKEYFTWLTPEQAAEVKTLRDAEKHDEAYAKTNEFYGALSGDKKTEATEKLKGACKHFFKASFGEAAVEEIKQMKESGSSMDDIAKKVEDFIGKITDEKNKAAANRVSINCKKIFSASRKRRDQHDEYAAYKEYFTWLTPDQAAEIKKLKEAKDEDGINTKIHEFYDALAGDKKTEAAEKLKGACKHFFKDTFGEAAVEEYKQMKESGSSHDDIAKKVEEYIGKIADEKKKALATRASVNCKKYFSASRKRRDHHNHEEYKEYFSWLSPEQGAEVKALRDAGKHEEVYTKVMEYFDAISGDKKPDATEKLKGACKHFFKDTFGEAAVEEIKQMKESGSSMDDIAKKVEEFIGKVTDEKKKMVATRASANCKKIFSASRRRRDQHDQHAEYKEYFTWLTPEQAAEVKTLRDAEKHDEAYAKTNEYYEALSGDKKTEATEKLKGACKHFFKASFGDAAVEEFKQLKESGSSVDDIAKKVEEMIGKITDDKKKAAATRVSVNCKKVFSASRKRRDHHNPEEYKEYFTWLTPEQAAEVKTLRDAEKHDEAYAKTNEFYGALEGDKKTEATEKLKGACKHFFKASFGESAVEEIKQMKESGSSMDDIAKKVEEFIGKITDDKKKAAATRVSTNCKKVFSASRRRRDHHDEYAAYKEYFTWLTPDQAAEIKKLKEAKDEDAINTKIHEFYDALAGDKKTEAAEKLKGACKHFFKDTFGEAAVEEYKQMKESGSSHDDIAKKVEEYIGKITDDKKKALATRASVNCKKYFSASRKRRDHHHDEYKAYEQYFSWLTPEQGAEVKKLKEAGDDEGINTKIHEYYAALSGDKKTEATEKLKGSCRHYFKDVFGEAAVQEFKEMKESGSSVDDIAKKVEDLVGKITDEKKKTVAARAAVNCKKLFGASRKRREHKHNIDEAITEFLPWLSDEQKAELKGLKESGAEEKMGEKIMEYFDSVDASKKDEARTKLQAGCKHFLKHLIGDAAAEEMKMLKETGATDADMAKKLEEIIGKMPDGVDKTKAVGMSKNCKRVYGVASRKRRHEHTLEEGFTEFLPWITDDQKMELKNMKEAGADEKIGDKIIEYFDSVDAAKKDEARSKLQAGCKHYLSHLLGDAISGEMKQMHEAGSSPTEMAKKLDEIIGKMEDGDKKAKAERLSKNCRKVYGVESRKRRNTYGEYDERYQKYYSWLKDEQRDELEELQDSGEDDILLDKISQYFKDLEEAKKEEARGQLKMGCRMRMRDLLGAERSEEIRRMKDEGATKGEMLDKVAKFVEAMEEGTEKETARRSYRHCAKILGRQRREAEKPFNLAEHTSWLKPEQRNELNAIIRSQELSSDDIYPKLFEYLNELEEHEKAAANIKMRAACRHWRDSFIGAGQSEKLKQMKQTGKKWSDIEHTMDGMIAVIEDVSVRKKAKAAIDACKHYWMG